MLTSIEILRHIKTLSAKTLNPHPRILLSEVLSEFSIEMDKVLVLLIELENRGLIKIHRTRIVSVSLTNYGVQNDSLGGIESYEQ